MASPRFRMDFPPVLTVVLLLAGAGAADAAAGVVSQPTFTCYTTGDYKTCYVDRQECSTSANFTAGSQYQANLLKLIADLPPAAIANGSFAETTAGSAPDRVFGLAMCYADRNLTQCQDCLRNASGEVRQRCPFSREAKISRDACILRYSNLSFFSDADREIVYYASTEPSANPYVTDAAAMSAARWALMNGGLVPEAASSSLRFANGSKEYTDSEGKAQVISGLAQCTRDLNYSMCRECLNQMVLELNSSRTNNNYGAVKAYSCYVAYNNILGSTTFPLAPQPSPPSTKPPAALIAGVTVGSVAFIFICTGILVSLLLLRRRRRRRKKARQFGEDVTAGGEEALEDDEFEEQAGPRRFRYSELEAATNFFSEEEKLGEGGFGSVYHGHLKDTEAIRTGVRYANATGQVGAVALVFGVFSPQRRTARRALRPVFLPGALDAVSLPSCATPRAGPTSNCPARKGGSRRGEAACRPPPWRSAACREERGQGGRVGAVSGGSRGPPPGSRGRRPTPRARAGGARLLQIRAGKLRRRSSGEGTQRRRPL